MKVSVSVHGRWHAFELATGLFERGKFGQLTTTYPGFIARRFVPVGMKIKSAVLLELRRRLYDHLKLGIRPDLAVARAFGRFAAHCLDDESDLLVGWSSATLEAIEPARSRGQKIVIERGSSHIVHQTDAMQQACDKYGLKFNGAEPGIVEREIKEYVLADAIAVPTLFAAETFANNGIDASKLIVNSYGVDMKRFYPLENSHDTKVPKIVFVGGVGIRKGVPQLLTAFGCLEREAELHLIGPIEAGFDRLLNKMLPSSGVSIHGSVASGKIPDILRSADIFCLPSLEEGFPLSMLQAMASGLPVVTTKEAGAEDIIAEGKEGMIVPAGDEEPLAGALAHLIDNIDVRRNMGLAARNRVASGYSWDNYVDRALAEYEKLLA